MASVTDKIRAANSQNEASFVGAVSATADANAAATAAQKDSLRVAEAAGISLAGAERDAGVARQQGYQEVASQLRVTPADENRVRLAKEIAVAQDQMLAANAELTGIAASNFSDNPLGWFVDQFRKPYVASEASAAKQRFADATTAYSTLDSVAQNGFQTVDKLNQIDAGKKFDAQIKQVQADTSFKVAQLDHEAARDGLAAARDLYQVGKDGNAQAWQQLQYETQQRNHAESMAMQRDHFTASQADKNQEKSYYELLRTGYIALSSPEQAANIRAIPVEQLKAALAGNPTLQGAAYNAGVQVMKNGGKFPKQITFDSQSPSAALNVAEQVGELPKSLKWVSDMKGEWAALGPTAMTARGLRPDGQLMLEMVTDGSGKKIPASGIFDSAANSWLAEKARNIKAKDGTNPFIAPPLSVIVANNPALAELATVKKLQAMGVAGEDIRDGKIVLKLLAEGGADINQTAKEVAQIYGNARAVSNDLNNLRGVGVSPQVLGSGYVQEGVDYTRPERIASAMSKLKLQSMKIIPEGLLGDVMFKVSSALDRATESQKERGLR